MNKDNANPGTTDEPAPPIADEMAERYGRDDEECMRQAAAEAQAAAKKLRNELIDLSHKHERLDAAFLALANYLKIDARFGDVARSLTDIIDPVMMPEDVQQSCISVIIYCRRRVAEQAAEVRRLQDAA